MGTFPGELRLPTGHELSNAARRVLPLLAIAYLGFAAVHLQPAPSDAIQLPNQVISMPWYTDQLIRSEQSQEVLIPRRSWPTDEEQGLHPDASGEWYYFSAIHPQAKFGFIVSAGRTPVGEGILIIVNDWSQGESIHTSSFIPAKVDGTKGQFGVHAKNDEQGVEFLGRLIGPYDYDLILRSGEVNFHGGFFFTGVPIWHNGTGEFPIAEGIKTKYYSTLLLGTGEAIARGKRYPLNEFHTALDHQLLYLSEGKPQNLASQAGLAPKQWLDRYNHNWFMAYTGDSSVITGTAIRKEGKPGQFHARYIMRQRRGSSEIEIAQDANITGILSGDDGFPIYWLIESRQLDISLQTRGVSPNQHILAGGKPVMMEGFGQIEGARGEGFLVMEATQRNLSTNFVPEMMR